MQNVRKKPSKSFKIKTKNFALLLKLDLFVEWIVCGAIVFMHDKNVGRTHLAIELEFLKQIISISPKLLNITTNIPSRFRLKPALTYVHFQIMVDLPFWLESNAFHIISQTKKYTLHLEWKSKKKMNKKNFRV